MRDAADEPPAKRVKLDTSSECNTESRSSQVSSTTLGRPISPPLSRRRSPAIAPPSDINSWSFDNIPEASERAISKQTTLDTPSGTVVKHKSLEYVASPVQLTRISDLAPRQNVDTVGLVDILGNPMIKECWNFNYLFDIDFVMNHFDEDVRNLVQVHIVHGFWKQEDANRIRMLEQSEQYDNVQLISAYIPDPFGTHHTKMLVLFYHDDHAQVIVHTANMISRDWTNMTQAVWRSPLLPLSPSMTDEHDVSPIGTGHRFKIDLLRYLQAYGGRLGKLTRQLADYDFSAIRAAFIGSAPSRQKPAAAQSVKQTSFGWLGLQEILSSVPITSRRDEEISAPHVIVQISSIATLGAAPTWLNHLFSVLVRDAAKDAAAHTVDPSSSKTLTFFEKKSSSTGAMAKPRPRPKYNIIFPTPDEIRTSLDGYAAGGSIHIKLQSAQQQKQIEYLTPLLCHWKHSSEVADSNTPSTERKAALRGPAAPHIKTYIRFTDETHKTIDWAMVTSANLSKQAWGDVVNKKEEIWIQSWEAGVVVWPELFAEGEEEVVMVPVFGRDMPTPEDDMDEAESMRNGDDGEGRAERRKKVVGFRMPYDLPLRPYKVGEKPWCATMAYQEPDWKGLAWGGY